MRLAPRCRLYVSLKRGFLCGVGAFGGATGHDVDVLECHGPDTAEEPWTVTWRAQSRTAVLDV